MSMTTSRRLLASCLLLALVGCENASRSETAEQALTLAASPLPQTAPSKAKAPPSTTLDVSSAYPAVDLIGAKRKIQLEKLTPGEAHSPPEAWKINFDKTGGFAGVCWKNRAGNEGEAPGDDLSKGAYRRISFWAKGAKGGEVAEFRAGGLGHLKTRYRDSFDVTAGKIKLTSQWSEYSIYVNDADLSSVMTVFCVLFHQEDNTDGANVYLDDIQYRG